MPSDRRDRIRDDPDAVAAHARQLGTYAALDTPLLALGGTTSTP